MEDVVVTPESSEETENENTISTVDDEDTDAQESVNVRAEETSDEEPIDNSVEIADGATVEEVVVQEEDTPESADENLDLLFVSEDMNIDLGTLEDTSLDVDTISMDESSQNMSSLSIEDVLDVVDSEDVIAIDTNEQDSINLDIQAEEPEWNLGDFQTEAELGEAYEDVSVAEGDSTVTLDITTDIEIQES